jgi:hypothetical protein
MPVSDIARKNHDELFPGHVSRLAATDPELIEYFDNFAFDEVLRHCCLTSATPGPSTGCAPSTRSLRPNPELRPRPAHARRASGGLPNHASTEGAP